MASMKRKPTVFDDKIENSSVYESKEEENAGENLDGQEENKDQDVTITL